MSSLISKYGLERTIYAHQQIGRALDYAHRQRHMQAAYCYATAARLLRDAVVVTTDETIRAGFGRLAEHCGTEREKHLKLSKEKAS